MKVLNYVACDLCGGTSFKVLHPATLDVENDDLPRYFTSSRTFADHLDIVRCKTCGLVMSNPRDEDASLAEVYQNLQDETFEAEEVNRAFTAENYLRWVNRHQTPGRLLDVGCATGIFMEKAAGAGWQVSGIEPSGWSAAKATERNPGAKIFTGRLDQVTFPPLSFDLVTFWDVLEHVPSPSTALLTVKPWLTEAGFLAMNLPNQASLTSRWMGKRWVHYLREHLWYFTPVTITKLLKKTGFEVVEIRSNRVRFSFANILTRLSQYRGFMGSIGRVGKDSPIFQKVSLRFPIGEMNVLARKK